MQTKEKQLVMTFEVADKPVGAVVSQPRSADILYALHWRISDDEMLALDYSGAVAMYDRVHASRDVELVMQWMWRRCRIHWGYQLLECLFAFNVWPPLSVIRCWWSIGEIESGYSSFDGRRLTARPEWDVRKPAGLF